jgi:hypothetical protein
MDHRERVDLTFGARFSPVPYRHTRMTFVHRVHLVHSVHSVHHGQAQVTLGDFMQTPIKQVRKMRQQKTNPRPEPRPFCPAPCHDTHFTTYGDPNNPKYRRHYSINSRFLHENEDQILKSTHRFSRKIAQNHAKLTKISTF